MTGTRVAVNQNPPTGIVLCVDASPLVTLKVEYRCCLDTAGHYMAVDSSQFEVRHADEREPLFRIEYNRSSGWVPSSHFHVHAHRDAATFLMARTGRNSPKGRSRASSTKPPKLQDLHFPLGGHRFRPCLEDVLTMLVNEFGVDSPEGAVEALEDGRAEWRRNQTRAAVRDSPSVSASVLRSLGYRVDEPTAGVPTERVERLKGF